MVVFHLFIEINSDYFPKYHSLDDTYKGEELCFLRGMDQTYFVLQMSVRLELVNTILVETFASFIILR